MHEHVSAEDMTAAIRAAERIPQCGAEFFMDFAFMRSSTEDYKRPNKNTVRVVTSYDGHSSHLIIVDGASRRVWAFLTKRVVYILSSQ